MAKTALASRKYRGRSAEQHRADRRHRLLDTGLELFGDRGYAHTPTDLLCSRAKVSTRHFYELFGSREELLDALLGEIVDEAVARVTEVLRDDSVDRAERVNVALRAFIDYMLEDPRRAQLVCIEAVGVSSAMEANRRRRSRGFARLIKRYADALAEAGLIPKVNHWLTAVALVGALNELLVESLTSEKPPSRAQMATQVTAMFGALIAGSRPQA